MAARRPSEALQIVRSERDSRGVGAVLALIEEEVEARKEMLVKAHPGDMQRLQGEVLGLRALKKRILEEPRSTDRGPA